MSETTGTKQDTRFKPWESWNPAGRPPWTRNIETLFRDAIKKIWLDQSIDDVERDLIITLLAKAKKWDMRAMEMYLDRLYGKPKQVVDNNNNNNSQITIVDKKQIDSMTAEELSEVIKSKIK